MFSLFTIYLCSLDYKINTCTPWNSHSVPSLAALAPYSMRRQYTKKFCPCFSHFSHGTTFRECLFLSRQLSGGVCFCCCFFFLKRLPHPVRTNLRSLIGKGVAWTIQKTWKTARNKLSISWKNVQNINYPMSLVERAQYPCKTPLTRRFCNLCSDTVVSTR